MPSAHHLLVDPIENLRGEQPQVVLDRLQFVSGLVRPVAVAEHLAQRAVLVGQLMDAVVVGVEPLAQHPQDQDLPLLHPGAPGIRGRLAFHALRDHLFEDGEYRLAQRRGGVDVLQPAQDLRDIVAGFGVQMNGGDILFAELQLWIDDLAHGNFE